MGEKLPDEYASDHLTPTLLQLLGGKGCGTGGSVPGCPVEASGDTPFVGNSTTITNDGATPVSWATSAVTVNVMWGPEGADHQTTTKTDDGKTSTSASWLYLDAQGTIRATANSAGATQTASAYTDFGAAEPTSGSVHGSGGGNPLPLHPTVTDAGAVLPNTTTTTPVGYTGQQNNPDAGLIQYQARTYQPGQQQWMQADTWAGHQMMPQLLNKYAFVGNNPATLIDPDGHDPAYASNCTTLTCRNLYYSGPPNPSASTVNSSGADAPTFYPTPSSRTVNSSGADAPTNQQNPSSSSARYSGLPYCSEYILDTMAHPNCQLDFRPETSQRELIELAILLFGGEVAGPLLDRLLAGVLARNAIQDIGINATNSYIDITTGKSILNIATNASKSDVEESLTQNGWSMTSPKAGIEIYTKDGAKYVLRDNNSSGHPGWTLDFTPAGSKTTVKIRLVVDG